MTDLELDRFIEQDIRAWIEQKEREAEQIEMLLEDDLDA